jgi:hypothetical protein
MNTRITLTATLAITAAALGFAASLQRSHSDASHGTQIQDYACESDACAFDSIVTVPAPSLELNGETHNARGGYSDACGDLPGMVGDDC